MSFHPRFRLQLHSLEETSRINKTSNKSYMKVIIYKTSEWKEWTEKNTCSSPKPYNMQRSSFVNNRFFFPSDELDAEGSSWVSASVVSSNAASMIIKWFTTERLKVIHSRKFGKQSDNIYFGLHAPSLITILSPIIIHRSYGLWAFLARRMCFSFHDRHKFVWQCLASEKAEHQRMKISTEGWIYIPKKNQTAQLRDMVQLGHYPIPGVNNSEIPYTF